MSMSRLYSRGLNGHIRRFDAMTSSIHRAYLCCRTGKEYGSLESVQFLIKFLTPRASSMTDRSVWTAEAKIDLDLGQNCKQCLEHIFKLRDILEYAKKKQRN